MSGERKHRSLKEILRKVPASGLLHPQQSPCDNLSISSHRFFLRKRNSKSSVTSSSASSVTSGHDLPMAPSESILSDDSTSLVAQYDEKKSKFRRKEKKEKRKGLLSSSNHSHHLLKRFFKILHPGEHGSGETHITPLPALPLSLTSDLAKKYDLGKLIGAGASGSVNLVTDKQDPKKVYAVKKFRAKLKGESEYDYMTKVKNEFLVGDYLTHQNLIHTMELIQDHVKAPDGGEYYIIMEYCPYDFFNLVMSGLMTKEEVYCYTKQIINGVHHLHKAGVAHRDLKLDNCVVDANGVLKLIDFGSAFQFRKQIDETKPRSQQKLLDDDHRLVPAKGIVGSDPYLSPEVFEDTKAGGYDARLADVWSIAIIFCCMLLKRFPWKVPRTADPSYRAFAGLSNQDEPVSDAEKLASSVNDLSTKNEIPKYGPERLLRLLPSKSRPLIRGMLEIDITKRYLIEDVVADPFYQSIEHCHYKEESEIVQEEVTQVLAPEPAADETAPKLSVNSIAQTEATSIEGATASSANDSTQFADHPDGAVSNNTFTVATDVFEIPEGNDVLVHNTGKFVKALNHRHHLITEKDLERINAEREQAQKLKENGMA